MTSTRRGIILSVCSAVTVASFLIPFKLASQAGTAAMVTLLTITVAAAQNTVFTAVQLRGKFTFTPTARVATVVLGVLTATGNMCMAMAIRDLEPAIASVAIQTQVLYVAIASWVLLGERVTPRFWVGAACALGGMALMRWPTGEVTSPVIGLLWALGAAVSFGTMQVYTRSIIQRIVPAQVNAYRLWFCAITMAVWIVATEGRFEINGRLLLYTSIAGTLGPFISRLFIMYALRDLSASHTTLVSLTAPAFALCTAFAVLGTLPSVVELIGGSIIMAGIALPVLEMFSTRTRGRASPRRDRHA